jgi:hypothetical protein
LYIIACDWFTIWCINICCCCGIFCCYLFQLLVTLLSQGIRAYVTENWFHAAVECRRTTVHLFFFVNVFNFRDLLASWLEITIYIFSLLFILLFFSSVTDNKVHLRVWMTAIWHMRTSDLLWLATSHYCQLTLWKAQEIKKGRIDRIFSTIIGIATFPYSWQLYHYTTSLFRLSPSSC